MAKSQNPKPKPQIFEHKPQKTIASAIAASKTHVSAANKAGKGK